MDEQSKVVPIRTAKTQKNSSKKKRTDIDRHLEQINEQKKNPDQRRKSTEKKRRAAEKRRKNNRKKEGTKGKKAVFWIIIGLAAAALLAGGIVLFLTIRKNLAKVKPEELINTYYSLIEEKKYEEMYQMLEPESVSNLSQEAYVERVSAIYEGIEARNITLDQILIAEKEKKATSLDYLLKMDTVAGEISFAGNAVFMDNGEEYKLWWRDNLIFPDLNPQDKVKVKTAAAERGSIYDRNGFMMAGKGLASSLGIEAGKFDEAVSLTELAELLEMSEESIQKKLSAKWIKDGYFVPLKTLPKISELDMMTGELDPEQQAEKERQDQLLEIPGVLIQNEETRVYALGKVASHLIGYVQNVTAEDLEKHAGEGYHVDSVIGRSGMEGLFEKELKGQDGRELYIANVEGEKKKVLAVLSKQDGKDIRLTIDATLQYHLYNQFKEDKSCSVAMNPYTGEVLALVSTPTFNNNDFLFGMSNTKWTALNEDEAQPMYNRFRQKWCPGSSLKPIIAAVGLDSGAVDSSEDYGKSGLSWQKDETWGSYFVTTLHEYEPVILENALVYSDNIYFAKAALKIGREKLEEAFVGLGFNEELPFEISMKNSQFSNTEKIESEIQLADSGYGQGQILVNPLHLASLYTTFLNDGNAVKPQLLLKEGREPEIWKPNTFSKETADQVLQSLIQVVNNPNGTGYAAKNDKILLAGKTGTAEIKNSKEDTEGTELGWFAVFTAEKETEQPVIIISMVEDVKDLGGSGYVVRKDKKALDYYFMKQTLTLPEQ